MAAERVAEKAQQEEGSDHCHPRQLPLWRRLEEDW